MNDKTTYESVREACPDTGTCHHGCPIERDSQHAPHGMPCFRVINCGPLSIMEYPDDRWPRAIKDEHLKAAGWPGVARPTPEVADDTLHFTSDIAVEAIDLHLDDGSTVRYVQET